MAETIRDLTIRIALELKKADLKVPDLSKAGFQNVAQDVAKVTDEIKTAAEEIKRYSRTQEKANDQAIRGTEAVAKGYDEIGDALGRLTRSIGSIDKQNAKLTSARDKTDELSVSEKIAATEAKNLALQAKKAADALNLIPEKVTNDLQVIGVNAVKAARGFALLGASDESIEELVRTLAKFQGVVDIFEGTTLAAKSAIRTFETFRTATIAASVGNTQLAASNVLVGVTAKGAAAALVAMIVAAGPLILIAASIAVVIATVVKRLEAWSTAAKNAALETDGMRKAAAAASQVQFSFSDSLKSSVGDLIPLQKQIELTKQAIVDLESERARPPIRARTAGDQFEIREQELERQKSLNEKIISQTRSLANLQLSANEAQRESLVLTQRQLETAQQAAAAEEDKEKSLLAQLGALSKVEKAQLQQLINLKNQGKELSKIQLQRLVSLVGPAAQPFAQGEFEQRGREGGFQSRLLSSGLIGAGTADRDSLAKLQQAITAGQLNVTAGEVLAEGFTALNTSDAKVKTEILATITALTERNNELFQQLREIADSIGSTATALGGRQSGRQF